MYATHGHLDHFFGFAEEGKRFPDAAILGTAGTVAAAQAAATTMRDTTFMHVPDLGLVVGGDIVYNGVHLYLVEGDAERRPGFPAPPWTELRYGQRPAR